MKLVVAEKPSVGRTIAAVLGVSEKKNGYIEGGDYIVTWCRGHLVEPAMPENYDEKYKFRKIEDLPIIPEKWKLAVLKDSADQYKIVKGLMLDSRVTEIVSATDAGREGECIFRYVYYLTGCKKPVLRLWTSSLEESAIRQGFAGLKPMSAYDNLFAAGFARAKADWLIGMNGSRLFSCLYRSNLSVGRVQTPTLAMIVQRDADIQNFVKKPYYVVELDCGFKASSDRFDEKPPAEMLQERCNGQNATVTALKRERKTENPPKLYDLTSLQRDANRMFGYTAKETLDYAQSLYEAQLITYPRTDSNYITTDMEQTVTALVGKVSEHIPAASGIAVPNPNVKRLINDKKVSDHHAILPTDKISVKDLAALPIGEKNILSLVSARLIAAVAEPHLFEAVSAEITCADTVFKATGRTVLQPGWKAADRQMRDRLKTDKTEKPEQDENAAALPPISEGQTFENVPAVVAERFPHPPKPFTDDTLLAAMERAGNDSYEDDGTEKKGLGTPATRAAIIEGLLKREYIKRTGKQIFPTEKGKQLIQIVPESLKSPKTTAEWETVLQHIEHGNSDVSAEQFTQQITEQTRTLIQDYSSSAPAESKPESNPFYQKADDSIGKCPKCGKPVREYPKSFSCTSGKDGCGFVIWKTMSGKAITAAQAKKLLEKGKTDLIKGFTSKAGKAFSAYVILKPDFTTGFEFPTRK